MPEYVALYGTDVCCGKKHEDAESDKSSLFCFEIDVDVEASFSAHEYHSASEPSFNKGSGSCQVFWIGLSMQRWFLTPHPKQQLRD